MGNVLLISLVAAIAIKLFTKPPRVRPPNLGSVVGARPLPAPRAKEGQYSLKGRPPAYHHPVAVKGRFMEESPPAPDIQVQPEDFIIGEARREIGVDCIKHYNFAVTGQSGVGKSSFVNAFLSLDAGDARAPVGEVEATEEIKSYSCQKWPSLKLWDIPGAGTIDHPAATYFEDKKLYVFDAILILTADRFLDVDFRILQSARTFKTPCVFVRTKCDLAVENRARRDKLNALEASKRLRAEVTRNFQEGLANAGLASSPESTPHLYFISNRFLEDADAYSIYDRRLKAFDSSLSSMDEQALITFLLDVAKIRA